MKPRNIPDAELKQCRRCGYEVVEVSDGGLCMSCEEYLFGLDLRERARRGFRVPAIPPPQPWPAGLVEAILKIFPGKGHVNEECE